MEKAHHGQSEAPGLDQTNSGIGMDHDEMVTPHTLDLSVLEL